MLDEYDNLLVPVDKINDFMLNLISWNKPVLDWYLLNSIKFDDTDEVISSKQIYFTNFLQRLLN